MEASQNRSFYGKVKCLSLWPTSIGQKGRTLKTEVSMERSNASPFGPPLLVRRGGLWAKHMGLK